MSLSPDTLSLRPLCPAFLLSVLVLWETPVLLHVPPPPNTTMAARLVCGFQALAGPESAPHGSQVFPARLRVCAPVGSSPTPQRSTWAERNLPEKGLGASLGLPVTLLLGPMEDKQSERGRGLCGIAEETWQGQGAAGFHLQGAGSQARPARE